MDTAGRVTLAGGKFTLGASSSAIQDAFPLWSSPASATSSISGGERAQKANGNNTRDANLRRSLSEEPSKIFKTSSTTYDPNSNRMSLTEVTKTSYRMHKSLEYPDTLDNEMEKSEMSTNERKTWSDKEKWPDTEEIKEEILTMEQNIWPKLDAKTRNKAVNVSDLQNLQQEKDIVQENREKQLKENLKLFIDLQQECGEMINNDNFSSSIYNQKDNDNLFDESLENNNDDDNDNNGNNNRRNSLILERLQNYNKVITCADINCNGEANQHPTSLQSPNLPFQSTNPVSQYTSPLVQFSSTLSQNSSTPNRPSSSLIQSSSNQSINSNTSSYHSSPIVNEPSRSHSRPSSLPSPITQRSRTVSLSSRPLVKRSSSLHHSSSTDNPPSSSPSVWKFATPFLCHRCSSPGDQSPRLSERGSNSLCDCFPCPQYHTQAGSPELCTPKHRSRTQEGKEKNKNEKEERINYYPKCDATIWIRSCTKEVLEPLSGVQTGVIPAWLRGTLIRNGPGRVQVGDYQYNHVFDGSALLHRFHFKDGHVTYQNKFLESRSYLRDTQAQRIVVNYFGTRAHPDPCKTILQNIASKFSFEEHFTDNAQISLYPYGDGLYALTETPFMYRIDHNTLETQEKVDLTRHIAVLTHTAHPHVDRDGTVYNIGQGVGPFGPRYHICKFPNTRTDSKGKTKTPFEQAVIVGSVSARWLFNPCYMHSFSMTENYWVIIEQPLVVSVAKILKVLLKQDALIDSLQWWEKETKLHVVRRDTGRVTSTQYVTETFFFLHTINAYEDNGHIILDIAAYKNAEMLHCMFVEALKNAAYDPTYAQMFRGRPKRWVLPLYPERDAGPHENLVTLPHTTSRARWIKKNVVYVSPELLADIGCEVPRIYYEEYNGRYYQYFYAICSDVDHPRPGTLVKVDVVNKTHVEWGEDNVYPSEPIFVPSPGAKREDEGVVLSALLRAEGRDKEVCLLILDAASFVERGRVEFKAPGPVPKCLHGWFVPEGRLGVYKEEDTQKEGKK